MIGLHTFTSDIHLFICQRKQATKMIARVQSLVACIVLALFLMISCASPVLSQGTQVVYVDGLHGSNTNNGTAASPYQTLNYTIGVLCNNVNPTYTVVVSPVSTSFIYHEQIGFSVNCATLDMTITSIDPAADEEPVVKDTSDLLSVPMAQIAWTTVVNGAIMSLTFDHITFTGQMNLGFDPTLDLGSTAMYSLAMQNCVFSESIGYNVPIDMATDGSAPLHSPIQFQMSNSIVQNSNTGVSFIYTAGATPVYVYVTNTQFVNNVGNGPIFNGNSIMVLVIDGCEFRNNSSPQYQLVSTQGDFQQSGYGPLPPAFNFTNNVVDGNSFGLLIAVQNREGAYLVDHNKITNNQFSGVAWNYDASSYFTGNYQQQSKVQPFVITNNVFTCNQANSTYVAFFARTISAGVSDPWTFANNVNGEPVNCPIQALPGTELVDPVNTESCLPGYYNNLSTGSPTHCVACPTGTYNAAYAATSCTACAPGTFASGSASQSCSPCAAGTHARTSGASSCDNCNSGYFAAQPGEIVCQKCAAGTCTPSSGAWTSCQQAPCSSGAIQAEVSLE